MKRPTRKHTKPSDARLDAPLLLSERTPLCAVSNQPSSQSWRKPAVGREAGHRRIPGRREWREIPEVM